MYRILYALVALACTAFVAFANDPPPILTPPVIKATNIAHSSVYVSVDLGSGRTGGGTGTVIASENGRSLILTNAHVVEDDSRPISVTYWYENYPYKSPVTYIGGSSVTHLGPELIQVNGPDLALLQLNHALPAVEIADAIPLPGTAVSLYGFGGADPREPIHKTGRVLAEDGWRTTSGDSIARTSIPTVNGDSGSGIFNAAGQLVAVHWGGGAVRLDVIHSFVVGTLRANVKSNRSERVLFPRLHDRLANPPSLPSSPSPPAVKAKPAEAPKVAPKAVPAPAPKAVAAAGHWETRCGTDSRGRKVCYRVWVSD